MKEVYDMFLSIFISVRSRLLVEISVKSLLLRGKGLSPNLSISDSSVARRHLSIDLRKGVTSSR